MSRKTKRMEKQKNISKNISLILMTIFLVILIFSLIQIIRWIINNNKTEKVLSEISDAINIEEKSNGDELKYIIDFEKLKSKNKDIIGWLKVNNTNIEYPIVKSNDNNFYLTHSIDKSNNTAGWPFVDFRNKIDGADKNIVIYGHNRKDKSMFGTLQNILNEKWYNNDENRKIIFITENENVTYEVFSVYKTKNEDYYIQTDFKDNTNYDEFIKTIKGRSLKNFNVEVTSNDNILTLSTCANNNKYRVVLHAKKNSQ